MHNLIKPIFRTLRLYKEKAANCVLIRHSMRRPINDGKAAFDAGLTSEGERLAQEFGYYINLYTKPSKFVCSPVGRCIDTALRISMGANSGKNILPDYRLSHTYISESLLQLSTYKLGQPVPTKIKEILNFLLDDRVKGLTIAVSHDTVVVCLAAYLMGVAIDSHEWPDYFEGIGFWKSKDQLILGWREKLYSYPL